MLDFVKGRLTVEVGAAKELDVVSPAPGGEAGVAHIGSAGLAVVARLLGRPHSLLLTRLSASVPHSGITLSHFKSWYLWHANSVSSVILRSLDR